MGQLVMEAYERIIANVLCLFRTSGPIIEQRMIGAWQLDTRFGWSRD